MRQTPQKPSNHFGRRIPMALQQDMVNAQNNLNTASKTLLKKILDLSERVKSLDLGTQEGSAELQRIQLEISNLQRDLEAVKQMEEKLAKAMETINKFVQAQ
jgi:chromosome segregation ATPase